MCTIKRWVPTLSLWDHANKDMMETRAKQFVIRSKKNVYRSGDKEHLWRCHDEIIYGYWGSYGEFHLTILVSSLVSYLHADNPCLKLDVQNIPSFIDSSGWLSSSLQWLVGLVHSIARKSNFLLMHMEDFNRYRLRPSKLGLLARRKEFSGTIFLSSPY